MGLQFKAKSRIQPESPWTLSVASFWWDPNRAVDGYHGQPSSAVMEGASITTRATCLTILPISHSSTRVEATFKRRNQDPSHH